MDVVALGELLIDFTENGMSAQGNPLFEANPGGAPCNVLAMLSRLGHKTAFVGKVGQDFSGSSWRMRFERSESMQVDFEEIRKCIRRWRSYIILRMATVISPSIGIRVQI